MLPNADDGQQRIRKYLSENATPEAKPIPKENEKPKKETPKNDDVNTYDYSDDDKADDNDW